MKLLLAVLSSLFFFSCQETGITTAEQGKNIYYYPTSNIYFDADNNHYIVIDGDKGWSVKDELLPEQSANLGRRVLVNNPAVPVWKANDDHKMVYAASLYTTTDDYNQKFREDSLSSLPKRVDTSADSANPDTTSQKKEKRGVGKFLDRIFGGKKDKKNKKTDDPEKEDS